MNTQTKYVMSHLSQRNTTGGIGDRFRSIVSAMAISQMTNREIRIDWESPNIDSFIDIRNRSTCGCDDILIESDSLIGCAFENDLIQKITLQKPDDLWTKQYLLLCTNVNFVKCLSCNPHLTTPSYETWIKSLYKRVYKDILIPKDTLLQRVETIRNQAGGRKILALQVRTGDSAMGVHQYKDGTPSNNMIAQNDLETLVRILCAKINRILTTHDMEMAIFITSDNNVTYDLVHKHLPKITLMKNEFEACHVDFSKDENGILNAFSDHMLLSQCDIMVRSEWSGFSESAAVICDAKEIYSYTGNGTMKKFDLTSSILNTPN